MISVNYVDIDSKQSLAIENEYPSEALIDLYSKDACNIPCYEMLRSFEEAQKDYQKTKPSTNKKVKSSNAL